MFFGVFICTRGFELGSRVITLATGGGEQRLLRGRGGRPFGGLRSAHVLDGGPGRKQEGSNGCLAAEEGGLLAD